MSDWTRWMERRLATVMRDARFAQARRDGMVPVTAGAGESAATLSLPAAQHPPA